MTHFEGQVDKSGAALRHPEEKKANDGCLKIKGKNVFRIFFVRVHLHESSLSAPSGQARRIHAAYQQHDFPLGGTFRKFRRQTGSGAAMVGFKGLVNSLATQTGTCGSRAASARMVLTMRWGDS